MFVFALSEYVMPNLALYIDKVECRPIVVVECAPYRVVAVDRDGILDTPFFRGSPNKLDVLLEANSGVCTPTTTKP